MRLLYIGIIAIAVIGAAAGAWWWLSQPVVCCGAGSPVMNQLVSSIDLQTPNISAGNVSFKTGASYDPKPLSDSLGRKVIFNCDASFSDVCVGGGSLQISGDFDAKIGTCCNDVGCVVAILPTESDERDIPCLSQPAPRPH